MIRHLKKALLVFSFLLFVASPIMAITSPLVSSSSAACGEEGVLGIPAWYRGLKFNADCSLAGPGANLSGFIWHIVLNIINMALVIGVYIAVFFILYGGFLFITGGDKPGQVEKARKAILDAIIGLVISMAAIAIVNLVFGIIK